jgi:hypothetical protein
MPRQPRLGTPGALHHVMARGIERKRIFKNRFDKEDFLKRLAELCDTESLAVYAWVCQGTPSFTKLGDTIFYDFLWSQFIHFVFVPTVPTYSLGNPPPEANPK